MKTRKLSRTSSLGKRLGESRSRRKGREQRQAAERGKTVPFYAKEIAAKGLNPLRKSAHFSR